MLKKFNQKLGNMPVKKRLIICFIMVVCFASISGILGGILLFKADKDYSQALVENGFVQGEIGRFNTDINKGAANIRDIIFLTDEVELKNAQVEMEEIEADTKAALEAFKINCQTEEELSYIAEIEENLPPYYEKKATTVELGLQLKNDEALEYFRTEAEPYLDKIMTAAGKLTDLNSQMGEEVSAQLTNQNNITLVIIVAVIIVVILLSLAFANSTAKAFADPIIEVQLASAKLENGELDIDISSEEQSEIGEMIRSYKRATDMLRSVIAEIERDLQEIASGNFDFEVNADFRGDFIAIQTSMNHIIKELSSTMSQINEASDQVAQGAMQMADSAQTLAEGATDQAGSIEELTATIENVTALAQNSAENADSSAGKAKEYEREAEKSSREMQELVEAMRQITETSKEIGNIITEIEDIASQTNLLSLNASIEAARAGEAGKGFAVVADQIGKLAADSAKSAVSTKELIGNSISQVEQGNVIARNTEQALETVMEGIRELARASDDISHMSKDQADAMKQIEAGIDQISGVVQSNSASAQETSATSEELSAQSENLKALVEQFKLKS